MWCLNNVALRVNNSTSAWFVYMYCIIVMYISCYWHHGCCSTWVANSYIPSLFTTLYQYLIGGRKRGAFWHSHPYTFHHFIWKCFLHLYIPLNTFTINYCPFVTFCAGPIQFHIATVVYVAMCVTTTHQNCLLYTIAMCHNHYVLRPVGVC